MMVEIIKIKIRDWRLWRYRNQSGMVIWKCGSTVKSGVGNPPHSDLAIVVGKNSCQGKIMESLETEAEDTPLQEKLEAIATDIGYLGMISAAITVSVLFIRFFIEQGMQGFDWANNIGTYLHWWFGYIIVGVTIIVVAVPEGLPLAVIISLAYSVRKMLEE